MKLLKVSDLLQYVIWVLFFLLSVSAGAQERITIPRIEGEIKFDGIVDDAGWNNIQPLQMVMHTPSFGNQPTEKSEVMLCYDNAYLYIGARLFDSNSSGMLISSKKRD